MSNNNLKDIHIELPQSDLYFKEGLQKLGDHGAVLYLGNYHFFLLFRDAYLEQGIPIAVVYKPEFNDAEWKMVSEKGTVYSTGTK